MDNEINPNNDNNLNEKYRNVVRSKILKRIYEKNNLFDENEDKSLENSINNVVTSNENVVFGNDDELENKLQQKVRRQLSNEWRKTLERVLNYHDGYLDSRLEVSRKDAIRFFINTDWPEENIDSESEQEQESGDNKKKKKKRKKKQKDKTFKNTNIAVPVPEYDPNRILVVRRRRSPWINNNEINKIDSILTDSFEIELNDTEIDEDFLSELQQFFGYKTLVRLIREKIDLNSFAIENFLVNYQERFLIQEPIRPINQELILNRLDLANKSKFYQILLKSFHLFSNRERFLKENELNNKAFMLSIGGIKLNLIKHPLMNREDKMIKKLTMAFNDYQKSISDETELKLNNLKQQIDLIMNKFKNQNSQVTNPKEISMDLDLLRRLSEQHSQLISFRRCSLIKLIEQWSEFQNNLERYPSSSDLNKIDLRLEEIENVDLEEEKQHLNQLIAWRVAINTIIHENNQQNYKDSDTNNQLNINQIKENTYLDDGRLPGEPKFNEIELIWPKNFKNRSNDSSSMLNVQYFIDVMIGNKIMTTFDTRPLLHRSFNITWDNYRSFPLPIISNPTYMSPDDNDQDFRSKLPRIRVHEKNLSTKVLKNIAEIQLKGLPSPRMNSKEKSMKIEDEFHNVYDDDNDDGDYHNNNKKKKAKLEGCIEFQTFWSSLPFTKDDPNSDSDLFWMYDETKRKIKQLDDLNAIDQWLHDLRYQIDDPHSLPVNDQNHHRRQIELMQLLLKQKYQIELLAIYEEKKLQLNKLNKLSKTSENQNQLNKSEFEDDGTFCTDKEIDENKRFQMMIQRNNGHINYRNYRFMPLTATDLLLLSDTLPIDDEDKSSINVLLEFIDNTCQYQRDRLQDDDENDTTINDHINDVKISHDWCYNHDKNSIIHVNQWFITVVRVLNQIWEQSIKLNDNQVNSEKNGHSNASSIISYEDIIKEPTYDTISGVGFPLLNLFNTPISTNTRKLNPSRRIRRKEAINLLDAVNRDVQIHLLIQHASNVPLKIIDDNIIIEDSGNNKKKKKKKKTDNDLNLSQCSSFVEIKIDNHYSGGNNHNPTLSTSISDGDKPTWNESFKFKAKINPKNNIVLNLFLMNKNDHQSIDQDSDSIRFDDEFDHDHSKSEKIWLGQLKIPMISLLFVSKIEGTFSLFSPYFLKSFKSLDKSNQLLSVLDPLLKKQDEQTDESESPSLSTSGKVSKNVDKILALNSKDNQKDSSSLGAILDVRLSMFLATDPPIETPNVVPNSNFNSLESKELIDYCDRWLNSLYKRFPIGRRFLCMVNNLQHKSILATRFIRPLKPPTFDEISPVKLDLIKKSNSKLNKLVHKKNFYIELIIRYVSLIPVLSQSNSNSNDVSSRFIDRWSKSQIWLDAVQFLTFRIGCQVEHAILLCCFLLFLDKKAYLVLGNSLLDGPTAYVIVYPGSSDDNNNEQDDQSLQQQQEEENSRNSKFKLLLIDPKRGQQFLVQDYNCTLISIDCIVTPDNIYANIQKSTNPSLINYNLQRAHHWQPLFSYRNQLNFQNLDLSIQPQSINYGSINMDWIRTFETKLENYLREQFMTWRRQQTGTYTAFNRFCAQIIKRILPELEQHSVLSGHHCYQQKYLQIENNILKELNQIYDVHKMISYPLNVIAGKSNYTGMNFDQLSRLIYSTNLHLTHFGSQTNVEYVLVCHIHPYPCDLYSIWLWVGALASKSIVSS